MQQFMEAIKYLLKFLVDDYAGIFFAMMITPALTYAWKWMNGKENEVQHHRKRFIAVSAIFGAVFFIVLVGIVHELRPGGSEKRRAEFRSEIEDVWVGTGADITAVLARVRILNNGKPSIAWQWRMKVTTVAGVPLDASAPHDAVGNVQWGNNQAVKNGPGTYLPYILFENPLTEGAGRGGWVQFLFQKNMVKDFTRAGTKFELEFQDSFGTPTSSTFTMPPGREVP